MSVVSDLLYGLANWCLKTSIINLIVHHNISKVSLFKPTYYERGPKFMFFGPILFPIPRLTNAFVEAKIEQHDALRAGSHIDFRIKMPNDRIYDFVLVKKIKFPSSPGKPSLIVRTPHHSKDYFEMEQAVFEKGVYGEGVMKTKWRGVITIHKSNHKKLEFTIPDGDYSGRYAILKTNKGWLINRMNQPDPMLYWKERMVYINTPKARTEAYTSGNYVSEVKVNGAHYYLIPGAKGNLLISRRISVDGTPITRHHNIPQLRDMVFPSEYHGRCIHVEIINGGDVLTSNPARTAGLLNARPTLSLANQVKLKSPLRAIMFDIDGPGTYLERKETLKMLA